MTATSDLDKLKDLVWRDELFLRQFGLNENNVMEYFSNSPFYDNSSNNQTLREQNLPLTNLKEMKGIQFSIIDQNAELYVIAKLRRESETSTTNIAFFYILHGDVFMSPDIQSVVKTRLERSLYLYNRALTTLTKASEYTIEEGRRWIQKEADETKGEPSLSDLSSEAVTALVIDDHKSIPTLIQPKGTYNALKATLMSLDEDSAGWRRAESKILPILTNYLTEPCKTPPASLPQTPPPMFAPEIQTRTSTTPFRCKHMDTGNDTTLPSTEAQQTRQRQYSLFEKGKAFKIDNPSIVPETVDSSKASDETDLKPQWLPPKRCKHKGVLDDLNALPILHSASQTAELEEKARQQPRKIVRLPQNNYIESGIPSHLFLDQHCSHVDKVRAEKQRLTKPKPMTHPFYLGLSPFPPHYFTTRGNAVARQRLEAVLEQRLSAPRMRAQREKELAAFRAEVRQAAKRQSYLVEKAAEAKRKEKERASKILAERQERQRIEDKLKQPSYVYESFPLFPLYRIRSRSADEKRELEEVHDSPVRKPVQPQSSSAHPGSSPNHKHCPRCHHSLKDGREMNEIVIIHHHHSYPRNHKSEHHHRSHRHHHRSRPPPRSKHDRSSHSHSHSRHTHHHKHTHSSKDSHPHSRHASSSSSSSPRSHSRSHCHSHTHAHSRPHSRPHSRSRSRSRSRSSSLSSRSSSSSRSASPHSSSSSSSSSSSPASIPPPSLSAPPPLSGPPPYVTGTENLLSPRADQSAVVHSVSPAQFFSAVRAEPSAKANSSLLQFSSLPPQTSISGHDPALGLGMQAASSSSSSSFSSSLPASSSSLPSASYTASSSAFPSQTQSSSSSSSSSSSLAPSFSRSSSSTQGWSEASESVSPVVHPTVISQHRLPQQGAVRQTAPPPTRSAASSAFTFSTAAPARGTIKTVPTTFAMSSSSSSSLPSTTISALPSSTISALAFSSGEPTSSLSTIDSSQSPSVQSPTISPPRKSSLGYSASASSSYPSAGSRPQSPPVTLLASLLSD